MCIIENEKIKQMTSEKQFIKNVINFKFNFSLKLNFSRKIKKIDETEIVLK